MDLGQAVGNLTSVFSKGQEGVKAPPVVVPGDPVITKDIIEPSGGVGPADDIEVFYYTQFTYHVQPIEEPSGDIRYDWAIWKMRPDLLTGGEVRTPFLHSVESYESVEAAADSIRAFYPQACIHVSPPTQGDDPYVEE